MRLALVGYRRTGKDTVARILCRDHGYTQRSVGSIIKGDLDRLVQDHFGFSAYTEADTSKEIVRPLLETWGLVNGDSILQRFYDSLPASHVVNGRLQTRSEAARWRAHGGKFLVVDRPGFPPAGPFEHETVGVAMRRIVSGELGDCWYRISNDGTLEDLALEIKRALDYLGPDSVLSPP